MTICAACMAMLVGCFPPQPDPINDGTLMYVTVTDNGAADSCTVQIGPDASIVNPDLEPYMDCDITVNGITVPYQRTGTTYVYYSYSGSALGLDPGDPSVVTIENPNLDTVELAGTMPPAVAIANIAEDLEQYIADIIPSVTMTWTPVACTTYFPRIIRYDGTGQMYSATGIFVTGSSYTFNQALLTSSQGIKATDVGFTIQGVNEYPVNGCLGSSHFWTRSSELPVKSSL
jgi:hypothetical protein